MLRDLRSTPLWEEVRGFYLDSHADLFGQGSSVAEPVVSPDGTTVAFTGSGLDSLDGVPWRRVYATGRTGGPRRPLSGEARQAHAPTWSPSGRWISFLADDADGEPVLLFHDWKTGRLSESSLSLPHGIDRVTWHPTTDRLLAWGRQPNIQLGKVARHEDAPWMPAVRTAAGAGEQPVFSAAPGQGPAKVASPGGVWLWEVAWVAGDECVALVSDASDLPNWYEARLAWWSLASGDHEELRRPQHQAGWLRTSPNGTRVAWIEGLASDRGMVAGTPVVLDVASRSVRTVNLPDWQMTDLRWRDAETLAYFGLHGDDTVAGDLDGLSLEYQERWRTDGSCGMPMPSGAPVDDAAFVVAYEDWGTPRTLRVVGGGRADEVEPGEPSAGQRWVRTRKGAMAPVEWEGADGLGLSGLLITPTGGRPPYPLVVNVHGGPVWAWRNTWDVVDHTPIALLVSRGFAVLNPNGRGSVGRGGGFTTAILGAMGGADVDDYTSAVDAMVRSGVADPARVSVVGHSYGGFMACCLAATAGRFAAAVAISPATDWLSQHYTSAIPGFDQLFVGRPGAEETRTGPVARAGGVATPTLVIGCEEDDCTPVGQAIEFYRAVAERGAGDTALVVYPDEGHGVRKWPALLDQSVRIVAWLERYAK